MGNPTHFSGPLYHMGGTPVGDKPFTQEVFYVNGITWSNGYAAGDDNNPGDTIDKPLMTLTAALAKCTNEHASYIYLLDYWQPTGETWPISVNKSLVHIIGNQWSPLANWCAMSAVGSFPVLDIIADEVYLEGLQFIPNASYPGITLDDAKKNLWINKCYFPSGTYGLESTSGDWGFNIAITNCFFLSSLSSGGIYINDDPPGCYFRGNHFDRLTGNAIEIVQGAYHHILDNTFALKANDQGIAITLGSSVSRAFVDNNSAGFGAATTTSPYEDEGTVTTNNWGRNFLGGTQIAPA